MDTTFPSDAEFDALSRQVEEQLSALQAQTFAKVEVKAIDLDKVTSLPAAPQQQLAVEKATGEKFESFWNKYWRHARRDLCLPDGLLHKQWKKWKDLRSSTAVKVAFGALTGLGIPTASIAPIAVALTVFLLNVVANVGIEAICEGCAEDEEAREKARKAALQAKGK